MRILLTGWFSFWDGEVTAGDVLALESVSAALEVAGLSYDTAWSTVFRPGGLRLDDVKPHEYSHLIFVCGPVHGQQIAGLHRAFADCRRIAVGVTVINPSDPAVTGFDLVLARDGYRRPPVRDLAAAAAAASAPPAMPVAGVILTSGQGEYADRRRHELVTGRITGWLAAKSCAPVQLETRLDIRDWRLCSTAEAFMALLARLDIIVTIRLHGLALALSAGCQSSQLTLWLAAARSLRRPTPGAGRASCLPSNARIPDDWTFCGTGAYLLPGAGQPARRPRGRIVMCDRCWARCLQPF